MNHNVSLKSLLQTGEQIFAPSVWDCMSARAAEITGYKAILLSSACLAWSSCGVPDIGLLSLDEYEWVVQRIASSSPLALIIDAEEGLGPTPLHTYRTVKRLIQAGASAFTIEDSVPIRGSERVFALDENGQRRRIAGPSPVLDERDWLARTEAALEAIKGTDAMLIARTHAYSSLGLEAAIDRAVKATEMGAEMTYVSIPHWQNNYETCKRIAERLPGWKMYGDIFSKDGKSDIEMEDAKRMGYNLVTVHFLEYGSFYGMCDFAKHSMIDQSTIYADTHPRGGSFLSKEMVQMERYNVEDWLSMEKRCNEIGEKAANEPAPFSASAQE